MSVFNPSICTREMIANDCPFVQESGSSVANTIKKPCKQPKCLLMGKWIKKKRYSHELDIT